MSKEYIIKTGCKVDTVSLDMSYTKSTRAAEQNGVSAEVPASPVVMPMSKETNSWEKRQRSKRRLRFLGWPAGEVIPKELLDQVEQPEDGREDSP